MKFFFYIWVVMALVVTTNTFTRLMVNNHNSLLHQAVKKGYSVENMNKILSKDTTLITARDIQDRTPLHWAAILGNAALLEELLIKKSQVNAQDYHGNTALHYTVMFMNDPLERKKMIKLLIQYGGNPHLRNIDGYTVLDSANPFDYRDYTVRLLLSKDL